VRGGQLVRNRTPRQTTVDNAGSAWALAAHLRDEISVWKFLVIPGLRVEHILTNFRDDLRDDADEDSVEGSATQFVLLPGVAFLFQPLPELGILGGVHRGFSPVTPGQPDEIQPEVSINYEGGARFTLEDTVQADLVGFFNDYSNLSGQCTFSSGCSDAFIDEQFNGGEVHTFGIEASAKAQIETPFDTDFPLSGSYTFTQTELLTPFESSSPQLARVEPGDELPYIPAHQFAAAVGAVYQDRYGLELSLTFIDRMREAAGQGAPLSSDEGPVDDVGRLFTDAVVNFDLAAFAQVLPELQLYGKAENLLNRRSIVSRRPLGARPTRPLFVQAGVKVQIGSKP
ncbi:MAG: TonB-dependent receptor, partial [Myxococcota bacterium]